MLSNLYLIIYKKFIAISFLLVFSVADTVYAQGYIPLEALPGVSKTGTSLSEYLSAIFNIGVGLAGVFAVLMIVIGGVQFIYGASNPSARNEAKKKITNAIFGLILATSSWLILYIINPDLIKNSLNILPVSITAPVSVSPLVSTQIQTTNPVSISTQSVIPYSSTSYAPSGYSSTPSPGYSGSQLYSQTTQYFAPKLPDNTLVSAYISNTNYNNVKPKPKKIDTTNDFNMTKDCISEKVSGVCAKADLNSDGVIDISDLLLLSSSFKYNVNGDKIIDFKKGPVITSCFFKENSGLILPPDPPCDDEVSSCVYIPEVQSFPVKCFVDNNNDMVLTRIEFNKLKSIIKDSSSRGKISLRNLYNNLFNIECGAEFSLLKCIFFDRHPLLGRMIYSTIIQYDTNKDGVADFTGGDPLIDFNGDGVIDNKDSAFIKFMNESIFKDNGFMPIDFTFGGFEAFMFNSNGFTDRQIAQYCIGKTPIMGCSMADIDGSCSKVTKLNGCDVKQKDLDEFDAEVPKFDVNGDGIVNFSQPQDTATSKNTTNTTLKNANLILKKANLTLDNFAAGYNTTSTPIK